MKQPRTSPTPARHDRLIRERIHDPYRLRIKDIEPSVCPECGAVYRHGRWTWEKPVPAAAHQQLCEACHRIADHYPAGEVILRGTFIASHKEELVNLAHNVAVAECDDHPLDRIMKVEDRGTEIRITTTDVHLPHRIGHAISKAWHGQGAMHYDEEGYFARYDWCRND